MGKRAAHCRPPKAQSREAKTCLSRGRDTRFFLPSTRALPPGRRDDLTPILGGNLCRQGCQIFCNPAEQLAKACAPHIPICSLETALLTH